MAGVGAEFSQKKYIGTITFLGLNDILCNKKRYLALFVTFSISFVLITVPLNTLTTMESREMAAKFSLDPEAVYIETIEEKGENPYHYTGDIQKALRRVEREMAEKGYEARLKAKALSLIKYTVKDNRAKKLLTDYPIGESGGYCEYEEGTAPKLENDVAFSKRVMEANELWIGDRVTAKMEKEFPDHDWVTAWEVVDVNVGSIKNTMHAMQVPLTAMLCVLIMLITLLMVKLLVVRETGQCHAKKHRLP